MGLYADLDKLTKKQAQTVASDKAVASPSPLERTKQVKVDEATPQPINSIVNPSVNRPMNQSPNDIIPLAKPKGFYITQKQHEDLNKAVEKITKKMKGKTNMLIDRSVVLRLLIDNAGIDKEEGIDLLTKRLTDQLINQLTS